MADYSGINVSLSVTDGSLNANRLGQDFLIGARGLPLFRARVGGEYVYFTGTAPVGATDIVVVSPTGG